MLRKRVEEEGDGAREKKVARSAPRRLRVGFVCGKEDGDLVAAPGLPAALRCVDPDAPPSGKHRRAGSSSECHSDVAIWWWVRTHYASTVECDLISAPGDVTRARLEANDVNLLLGWDAVSAHLEEFDGTARFGAGHGDAKAALLRDPKCKVFPPGSLQDLCNAKGAYIARAAAAGVAVAPTAVYECGAAGASAEGGAAFAASAAAEGGWKRFIAKPSPSSWSRGVDAFTTSAALANPKRLERYFRETAFEGAAAGGAKQVLVQRHLRGLAASPETRCFFSDGEFQYAVANSEHRPGKPFALTSCPEASSSSSLPAKYWRPHAALAKTVVDTVLPRLTSFDGAPLSCKVPWLVRVDVGTHAAGDLVNGCAPDAPESQKRKRVCFVNEVEIVPTLYLAAKFNHGRDYLAVYARNFIKTAFEVAGRDFPAADDAKGAASTAPHQAVAAPKHNVALSAARR